MPVKTHITDPASGLQAEVDNGDVCVCERKALIVATRPLKVLQNSLRAFLDPNGSPEMAIGVEFGSDPEEIYDGVLTRQWTPSTPVGGASSFLEESTDHAKNGNITFDNNTIADITITFTLSTGALGLFTEGVEWNDGGDTGASADSLADYINLSVPLMTAISDHTDTVMVYTTSATTDLESIAIGGVRAGNVTATAQSVDATAANTNDILQLARPGGDLDLGGVTTYTAITGHIYTTLWNVAGIEISGWNTGTSSIVGNVVNLTSYINNTLNEWQQFTISLSDMGLVNKTIDAIRIQIKNKDFDCFLDYIEVQEKGAVDVAIYSLVPQKQEWLHVHSVLLSMADALDTASENNSMPNLSYDKFLGVAELSSGLIFQMFQGGEVTFSLTLKGIHDQLDLAGSEIETLICDGTNTYLTIRTFVATGFPFILKGEDGDKMQITVNDNLAGLLTMKLTALCVSESRD